MSVFDSDAGRLLLSLARRDSIILLVDEDLDTRGLTETFLRGLGSRVLAASDLQSAAQVLRSIAIDLIVARYDDHEAQSAAAALRACAGRIPIIAISAGESTLRLLLEALGKALEETL